MKAFTKLLALLCLTGQAFSQTDSKGTVIIKGKMNGDTKGYNKVYLYGTGIKPDSATMTKGQFEFVLPFEKPFTPLFYTEYDKSVKRMYTPYVVLVEEPGLVQLSDGDITQGMGSLKVSGMRSAIEFNSFRQQQAAMFKKINEQLQARYGKAWLQRDDPNYAAFTKEREELVQQFTKKLLEDFVQQYPDSYAAALALSNNGRTGVSIADLQRIHGMLSKKRQQSEEGKIITDYIAGVKGSAIGSMVKDFTLNTPEETPLSFSQLKGKYVLIDFWASWCGPCKASFPHMKEVYKKYKSDQFEIYSISIDKDKAAWLKGLKEQELPWLQTLDTKNISQSGFAVTGVPTTYLIDPKGTILMKEVGFEPGGNSPLEKKLVELFGAK